ELASGGAGAAGELGRRRAGQQRGGALALHPAPTSFGASHLDDGYVGAAGSLAQSSRVHPWCSQREESAPVERDERRSERLAGRVGLPTSRGGAAASGRGSRARTGGISSNCKVPTNHVLPTLTSQSSMRGWLFRIAHNKAIDHLRRSNQQH